MCRCRQKDSLQGSYLPLLSHLITWQWCMTCSQCPQAHQLAEHEFARYTLRRSICTQSNRAWLCYQKMCGMNICKTCSSYVS
jgi:hypothetical protein